MIAHNLHYILYFYKARSLMKPYLKTFQRDALALQSKRIVQSNSFCSDEGIRGWKESFLFKQQQQQQTNKQITLQEEKTCLPQMLP